MSCPALIHPMLALSRLRPNLLQVVTLIAAHLRARRRPQRSGSSLCLALRELLHAVLGTAWFRRISVIVQGGARRGAGDHAVC